MNVKEITSKSIFLGASILTAGTTLFILGFMLILAFPILTGGLLMDMLTKPWSPDQGSFGLISMIAGSIYIAFLALTLSFPISLGCSYFIGICNPVGPGKWLIKVVEFMTAIPTVIYGFTGIILLVPIIREWFLKGSGMCILSAAIMLGILISPTMILFFTQSFKMVPPTYLNAVDALGGSSAQKFLHVVLPYSLRGMLTGIILSFGRAMGDTLIALMISGNSVAMPGSILDSARTLTAHIALIIAADFDSIEFKTIFICGILLYSMTGTGVILVRYSARKTDIK